MNRFVWIALAASLTATPALAEGQETPPIDMARVSCKDFMAASPDDRGVFLFWIHGYYAGKADSTLLDFARLNVAATHIAAVCKDHEEATVMQVIEALAAKPEKPQE